jgi:heterodisulfide reductase subunit A-like polyferredoxin
MIDKDSLSVIGGGVAGLSTAVQQPTVLGTQAEFLHLVLYAFVGGVIGWLAKELAEYCKKKITKNKL